MEYEVRMTFRHWVTVQADSEDEALDKAEDLVPTFVSDLEDYELEVDN